MCTYTCLWIYMYLINTSDPFLSSYGAIASRDAWLFLILLTYFGKQGVIAIMYFLNCSMNYCTKCLCFLSPILNGRKVN